MKNKIIIIATVIIVALITLLSVANMNSIPSNDKLIKQVYESSLLGSKYMDEIQSTDEVAAYVDQVPICFAKGKFENFADIRKIYADYFAKNLIDTQIALEGIYNINGKTGIVQADGDYIGVESTKDITVLKKTSNAAKLGVKMSLYNEDKKYPAIYGLEKENGKWKIVSISCKKINPPMKIRIIK